MSGSGSGTDHDACAAVTGTDLDTDSACVGILTADTGDAADLKACAYMAVRTFAVCTYTGPTITAPIGVEAEAITLASAVNLVVGDNGIISAVDGSVNPADVGRTCNGATWEGTSAACRDSDGYCTVTEAQRGTGSGVEQYCNVNACGATKDGSDTGSHCSNCYGFKLVDLAVKDSQGTTTVTPYGQIAMFTVEGLDAVTRAFCESTQSPTGMASPLGRFYTTAGYLQHNKGSSLTMTGGRGHTNQGGGDVHVTAGSPNAGVAYTGTDDLTSPGTAYLESDDTHIKVEEYWDSDTQQNKGVVTVVVDNTPMMEFGSGIGDNCPYSTPESNCGPQRVEVLQVLITPGFLPASSDRRIKEDIEDADTKGSLDTFRKLRLREYRHTPDYVEARNVFDGRVKGFVAQEVEEILPHAVHTMGRTFKGKNSDLEIPDMKHIQYDYMYLEMFGAMKELLAEVDTLKADVATLTQQLAEKDVDATKDPQEVILLEDAAV
jgi:hypothetical protein